MARDYAVVDVETTGLHPGWHHRIVEVAVIRLDQHGQTVDEWCTLINPERDLGPQHIHGISAAEARHSPKFQEIAGSLAARLAGAVVVGHNVSFDLRFITAEFARLNIDVPLDRNVALCTMSMSDTYLRAPARSLAMCCRSAGIALENAHSALHDARATAQLLAHFLSATTRPVPWSQLWNLAARQYWPAIPGPPSREVRRGNALPLREHFLARLVDTMPRISHPPRANEYLAVLDRALLDRHLSETEQDELVGTASELGLGRADTEELHRRYLLTLAAHAWEDQIITEPEREDLLLVAALLGLPAAQVDHALVTAKESAPSPQNGFQLQHGDSVVFTGQMSIDRDVWTQRAVAAGLKVQGNVTKRTRLLIAADPDSMSGKAKKARAARIPVITETAFMTMLELLESRQRVDVCVQGGS